MADDKPLHVYPTNGPEHVLLGVSCWCEPEVELNEDSVPIYIHRELH